MTITDMVREHFALQGTENVWGLDRDLAANGPLYAELPGDPPLRYLDANLRWDSIPGAHPEPYYWLFRLPREGEENSLNFRYFVEPVESIPPFARTVRVS